VVLVRILWFLEAKHLKHFISELTKFELIIIIFEHNDVYLSPTLRINCVFIVNAVLSARYSTYHHHGRSKGRHLGPWSPKYTVQIPHISLILLIYEKVVLRLSELGVTTSNRKQ